MAVLAYRYVNEPNARDLIVVVGIWSALNLLLTGTRARRRLGAPRAPQHAPRRQQGEGHPHGRDAGGPVVIDDMSFGGLQVRALGPVQLPPATTATLRIATGDADGRVLSTPVVSAGRRTLERERGFGLKFYGTSGDRFRIIARVVFSDIAPIHKRRVVRLPPPGCRLRDGGLRRLVDLADGPRALLCRVPSWLGRPGRDAPRPRAPPSEAEPPDPTRERGFAHVDFIKASL